jgi:hypothetical protein
MTKRKDDSTPAPPGGRAAERLREFERARGLEPEQPETERPETEQPETDKKPTSGDAHETAGRKPVSSPHRKKSEKR